MSLTSATKTETNTYELEIAVGAEDLKAATDKVFKRKAKDITVPGFRKGKAPRKVIEKMYGEGVFVQDAVDDLFPGAYSAAVDEAGIEPVDRANVEMLSLNKEEGFTFKATVTVRPEVTMNEYKGLEVEKTIYTVTDHDVDHEIEHMRERNGRLITIEDRPAVDGDSVIIDFEGFMDGVAFDGGKGDGYRLTLGSNSFIDNFEQQIEGHNPGDEFDVNVTFPEDYNSEELKGKPALFKVKLVEIKGKELPELDDEFVKDISEFDTLDELKADIRKKKDEENQKRTDDELENSLIGKIIENMEAEIPAVMFQSRMDEMAQEFAYNMQNRGIGLDLYLQYTGMDVGTFREGFREQAERQVKIRLALSKIAEMEEIVPTAEEIEKEYERLAEQHEMEIDRLKAAVAEKDVAADLKSSKAMDLVKEAAKITEKQAEPQEHDHH